MDSTMGHIRDLPKSKLGIDIENNFKPEYVFVAKKKESVQHIKQDALKAERIYLATDPDREGEAIAWHVAEVLKENRKKKARQGRGSPEAAKSKNSNIFRIVFHEITESAVKHALETPGAINFELVDAQQARRVLDRLVGYKLSPLLWKKIRRGLSAGRVQSVAVRLIVEREREIEAFKPVEYWEIYVGLRTKNKEQRQNELTVKLVEKDGEKIKTGNKDEASKAEKDLEKASYSVASISRREVRKSPPAPFTTSTVTQAAARMYFWSAKRTMSIAQRLYEEGLITYHRTDSTNLSQQALDMARAFITESYGDSYLPEKPRIYKTRSKVAQEAHEAIRPTQIQVLSSKKEVIGLGNDAKKLYELIWKRFVACQMSQTVLDETRINVKAEVAGEKDSYLLRTSGQIVKFDGWRKLFPRPEEGVVQLPEVEEGEPLQLIKVDSLQKFTEHPPRYNEASLVKMLEKLGIGRPSTYAPIISTIQDRQYVEKTEGKFQPTALGIAVNDFVVEHFPKVVDYQFTANMEDQLDEVANGNKEWVPIIREFWEPFSQILGEVEEKAQRVRVEVEKTGKICPKCKEGEEVIRLGRFGRFLSCSRFPECDWTAPYVKTLEMKCPECGEGNVIIKKSKKGRQFFGCSRYPDCKFASWRKPKDSGEKTEN